MLNKVQVIGRLGKDPEVRHLANGTPVCNFSVAASERWKDKDGEQQESTEWFRCSTFDKLAEICGEYLKKGALVYIEGSLKTREYEKDGAMHRATEVRVSQMKMLGSKSDSESPQRPAAARPAPQKPASKPSSSGFDDMEDDIPFN